MGETPRIVVHGDVAVDWLDVAVAPAKVLAESGEPMNTRAMFDAMVARGYWTSDKATPQNTIYAAIAREIKTKGDDSRFRKGEARGTFELNR